MSRASSSWPSASTGPPPAGRARGGALEFCGRVDRVDVDEPPGRRWSRLQDRRAVDPVARWEAGRRLQPALHARGRAAARPSRRSPALPAAAGARPAPAGRGLADVDPVCRRRQRPPRPGGFRALLAARLAVAVGAARELARGALRAAPAELQPGRRLPFPRDLPLRGAMSRDPHRRAARGNRRRRGPFALAAGAGSGKTSVLVDATCARWSRTARRRPDPRDHVHRPRRRGAARARPGAARRRGPPRRRPRERGRVRVHLSRVLRAAAARARDARRARRGLRRARRRPGRDAARAAFDRALALARARGRARPRRRVRIRRAAGSVLGRLRRAALSRRAGSRLPRAAAAPRGRFSLAKALAVAATAVALAGADDGHATRRFEACAAARDRSARAARRRSGSLRALALPRGNGSCGGSDRYESGAGRLRGGMRRRTGCTRRSGRSTLLLRRRSAGRYRRRASGHAGMLDFDDLELGAARPARRATRIVRTPVVRALRPHHGQRAPGHQRTARLRCSTRSNETTCSPSATSSSRSTASATPTSSCFEARHARLGAIGEAALVSRRTSARVAPLIAPSAPGSSRRGSANGFTPLLAGRPEAWGRG